MADAYNPVQRPIAQQGFLDVATDGRVQTTLADREQAQDFIVTRHQQVMALGGAGDCACA